MENSTNNVKEVLSNIIKDVHVESGKPLSEYKDFLNIWSELTKPKDDAK